MRMVQKKKTTALLLAVVVAVVFLLGNSDCRAYANGVSINASEVELYALESWSQEYLQLPDDISDSFQLSVTGASKVTYSVTSGKSIQVDANGLVTVNYTTYYWYNMGNYSVGYTVPLEGVDYDRVSQTVTFGESIVRVIADGVTFYVKVNVVDYADVYADKVMDDYIAQCITDEMTEYEKLDYICKFVAGFDYSVSYSGCTSMIVAGGGDCWASTSTIIAMCEKLGINAWSRVANRDPGAGSGHMNVMVEIDGKYYEADAGYNGKAPRYYSLGERSSLYSFNVLYAQNGAEIYQYDGHDKIAIHDIPGELGGRTVIGIGEDFLSMDEVVRQVYIPETIQYIGDSAFNSCISLEQIHIPAAVESIGDFVFTACDSLKKITCDPGNTEYSAEGGILYNKDKSTLLYAPAVVELEIPESVTEVADYSLYYNKALKTLVIPKSVTTLGEGAFGDCSALQEVVIEGGGLKTVGDFAFANDDKLKTISFPSSVDYIGNYVFSGDISLESVYVYGKNTKLSDNTFGSQYGGILGEVTIHCYRGSLAQQYAIDNGIEYVLLDADVNGDGEVNSDDAVWLLYHTLLPETYPVECDADFDGNGFVDSDDAVRLLYHTLMPNEYPLQ